MAATTYNSQPFPLAPLASPLLAAPVEETSPFQRLGFNVLLVFIFLAFSRIFDVKFGFLHITGIAYRVVFAMVLLSRGFQVALNSNIGKALLGFTVCFGVSVPFSVWRTGSKDVFLNQWLMFSFVAFLAVAGLVHNYQQWFKLFKTLAYALFVFTLIANVFGVSDNGRLFLAQGKFANPNEMAQALLLGLPLWGALMVVSKSLPGKAFAAGVMVMILVTTFRTGSRGAMIGFVATFLVAFLRAPVIGKLKIVLAGVLFLGIVLTTMPGRLIARYKTVAEDEADVSEMDGSMAESATASTLSRKMLLRHSLIFTVRHPLFGVGPGMFAVADDAYSKEIGFRKGTWAGTHNSYTQVSSELGIPGFLFFVAAVAMALKGTHSIHKKTRGDPRLEDMGTVALALHYCLIVYAVTILFDHIAYTVMLPVFGGLAASLVRTAEVEIQRIQSLPLPVSMSTTMFHGYLAARHQLVTTAQPPDNPERRESTPPI
jgi:O-antigen ligase